MSKSDEKASGIIKSITSEQLEKTRSDVHAEVESNREDGDEEPEPDEEDEGEEGEEATDDTVDDEEPEPESAPSSKDARIAKLDLIQDMQLILIDRYRSASKLLVAAIAVLVLILAGIILQFSRTLSLHGKVIVIAEQQADMVKDQQQLAKDTAENKKDVEQVRVAVAQTKEKVEEAVEASPKLEYDPDSGKTKVVVPVKRKDEGKKNGGDKPEPKKPPASKPAPKPPAPPPPVDLHPQVELKDDY